MRIANHGQISLLPLPKGWWEEQPRTGAHQFLERIFHPDGKPEVNLILHYRGVPVKPEVGKKFEELLAMPDRIVLSSQLAPLAAVLDWALWPEFFKLIIARTQTLGTRRVLVLEGRLLKQDKEMFAIFVPVTGHPECVQEIHFQASKTDFHRYLQVVKQALAKIEWT